jgi:hypothetical protein
LGWIPRAKLTGSDTAYGDHFGWSVGVSGGMALIGADWDDDNGPDSGSAYMFNLAACPADFDADPALIVLKRLFTNPK